jgi:hypothetical protein
MIIQVKSEPYGDEYLVCPHASLAVAELRDRMLQRAKVIPGSYAYRLIDDLYAAIFLRSLDLTVDYEKYFASEYESFGEYLRRRAHFSPSVITGLAEAFDESAGMYHFQPRYTFLADEYGFEFLEKLLDDPLAGES